MEPSKPGKTIPFSEMDPEVREAIFKWNLERHAEISAAPYSNLNKNKACDADTIETVSLIENTLPPPTPKKSILDVQRLNRAIEVAAIAHKDQFRKGTETPYFSHPYGVGMLLAQTGCPEDVVIAGILHDTVEDTPLTLDYLRKRFGNNVAEIVAGCSEHDKELEWKERKQHTIDHLELASKDVKLVTCADKLHNVTCMLTDYALYGETLWSRFNEGPYEQEWYFQSLANTLTSSEIKSHPLVELFSEAVQNLFVEQRAKYKNVVQSSRSVGDDIDDDYCGWSSVWEPDLSEDFFGKFLIPRDCTECDRTEECEDYYEEDPCGCNDIDLDAAVDHLREIAPHILWKIDTNGYDDCDEGAWQWSTISVPDNQVPEAERIIGQIQKGEDISLFRQLEDFYPYLYDEKKRLRQEISDLFRFTVELRRFIYRGYEEHITSSNDKIDAPIRYLIKLLGHLYGAGKGLENIQNDSDWPDLPDEYKCENLFETSLWGKYGCYAKKHSLLPKEENPFKQITNFYEELSHVLEYFIGEGPDKIAQAVKYWQYEFSSPNGWGESIRTVLMHLHDIIENITIEINYESINKRSYLCVSDLITFLGTCPQHARIVKPHRGNLGLDDVVNVRSQPVLFNIRNNDENCGPHEAYDCYELNEMHYEGDGVILLSDGDNYNRLVSTKPSKMNFRHNGPKASG